MNLSECEITHKFAKRRIIADFINIFNIFVKSSSMNRIGYKHKNRNNETALFSLCTLARNG